MEGQKLDNVIGGLIVFQMIQKTVRHVRQQAEQEQGKEVSTADFRGQGEELLKDVQYHNQ